MYNNLFVVREVLMLCALNAITEHRQLFQLVLIIPFQAVQRTTKRFVWHNLFTNESKLMQAGVMLIVKTFINIESSLFKTNRVKFS